MRTTRTLRSSPPRRMISPHPIGFGILFVILITTRTSSSSAFQYRTAAAGAARVTFDKRNIISLLSRLNRNTRRHPSRKYGSSSSLFGIEYGRGAEIWPECNEQPIRLEDSFPNARIPPIPAVSVLNAIRSGEEPNDDEATTLDDSSTTTKRRKRRIVRKAISRILRGAAGFEADKAIEAEEDLGLPSKTLFGPSSPLDKSPILIALSLLIFGLVRPSDILFIIAFNGYLLLLSRWNSLSTNPIPALPPQNHVPALVLNPLGHLFTNSNAYRMWIRLGALVGLVFPLGAVGYYKFYKGNGIVAGMVARPLFFICCQAISEALSRRSMAPLPLRILIPVAYNVKRLDTIWEWTLSTTPLGMLGRFLAATNFIYWNVNLFGFLLPTATMRYMRAHFFCVEASEVTTREDGGESAVGLLSS